MPILVLQLERPLAPPERTKGNRSVSNTDLSVKTPNEINQKFVVGVIAAFKKSKGYEEGLLHKKIFRPWGNYISLVQDKRWQVKRIEVNPGSSLSLQMHQHRAEHWTVVEGKAKVKINLEEFLLLENQSTFIPQGAKHRLSNPGKKNLILIEVQSGDYLGEDDIFRFEDNYGRDTKNN